jgi:hypothetical protein
MKEVTARLDAIISRFDVSHFRAVRGAGHPSERPIFIVGMPRSGTTLVEQILASHSMVFGAGELGEIPRIAADLSSFEAGGILAAAQRYLDSLGRIAPTEAQRVTDKLPVNYRHLGVIATLFPNARIVHCRRDPRDIALSCFIEMFNIRDLDFTDLEGIAHAIVEEARLMQHWRTVLPVSIFELDYAQLVMHLEIESRRLVEYCGLPWEDHCLSFHRTERNIDTPSRWQVRQPIYSSSAGRWRNYAHQLQSAISILDSYGLIDPD